MILRGMRRGLEVLTVGWSWIGSVGLMKLRRVVRGRCCWVGGFEGDGGGERRNRVVILGELKTMTPFNFYPVRELPVFYVHRTSPLSSSSLGSHRTAPDLVSPTFDLAFPLPADALLLRGGHFSFRLEYDAWWAEGMVVSAGAGGGEGRGGGGGKSRLRLVGPLSSRTNGSSGVDAT